MKRSFSIISYCFASICIIAVSVDSLLAQPEEASDGIAAVVNGATITLSQVRELVAVREKSFRDIYSGTELQSKVKEARTAALNDLIDRKLILQEFKKKEFSIPDYVIDDDVNKIIREEFGNDRSAFVRTLKAQGYTVAQFKEVERDKIIVQAMRAANIKDDFVISPKAVQFYYEKSRAAFSTPEQVKLRMIVLREEDGGQDKGQMAEEIRGRLNNGADFERMATMYSEDSTQDAGGDWGWIDKNTLNKELSDIAFGLRAGEVSKVKKVSNAYYILMVEARKNATVKPLSEVRDEIQRRLTQEERLKNQQRWLAKLRQDGYVKVF
ncbi:MAG: peptidyl-prolyl cis-trans isomerase [Chthoniobacterales bacterium]